MKSFIIIVMMCHLDFVGQEGCIPMTPNPQIYYQSKEECLKDAENKVEDMKSVAIYNSIQITQLYFNCIEDKSKPAT